MARNGYKKISTSDKKDVVSFVSLLFFQWMNSVFQTGSERPLDQNDFVPFTKEHPASFLTEQLQASWNKENVECQIKDKKPKLWKCVIKMLSVKDAVIMVSAGSLYSLSRAIQPLFLGYLISTLMSADPHNNYFLYGCTFALCVSVLIMCFSVHHHDYRCEMLGIKISSALKGLVYDKVIHLSKHTILKYTTGRVIDFISNDVQRLEEETVKWISYSIFTIPSLAATTVLIVHFIGWQAIMGVIFLCLFVPYFAGLSYVSAALRLRTAAVSDRRISLMSQVVSGIRAIKRQAWEEEYRKKIKMTRRNEVSIIRKKSAILSAVVALLCTTTPMATLVSVITLLLTGQPITPVSVFMLLTFIDVVRLETCSHMASAFLETYDAYASLGRIEDFLRLEDLPVISRDTFKDDTNSTDVQNKPTKVQSCLPERQGKLITLRVSNLTYKQVGREDEFILQNIKFSATSRSLTVITGPVGSGKSTLLSAIAGEISDITGAITCQGSFVYVPQIAWIFSGTIRENILFGQPYNEPKYTRVIEACSLAKDIQQFPDLDQTVVGERGEVLSGGQQARVSLARAVYAEADIYLLDDPLSAVDFKVGQDIFEKCIIGLLENKTRVLTSHHEHHMKEAGEVVVLYKGRVLKKGRFSELQAEGVLNTTVDPLYKKECNDDKLNIGVFQENEQKSGNGEPGCQRTMPPTSEAKGLEISQEDRAIGEVSWKLYWEYFRSGQHASVILGVICYCFITQAMIVAPDVWLSFLTKLPPEDQRDKKNLTIYGCLVAASLAFAVLRAYGFLVVSLRCSERLHDQMVVALLQAPVLFFDSNPVGRILNRFSKDVGSLDELLPKTFLAAIQYVLMVCAAVIVPTVTNPWLLILVVPLTVLVVYISRYYLKTSRQLKRLESICRSPVFSHISETLNGLDTIRTRGRQKEFKNQFFRHQDSHNQSYIMVMASGRWLGVRLDLLAFLLICAVSLAAVLMSQEAAFAGLALVYVIQTSTMTQYAVRKTSDVENFMTSVERVMAYTKLESEPGYKVKELPPENWPREGTIIFQDVSLTYYSGGPQVLKNLNLNIKGGTKIGVAGRTGAGKSSFVAALMRMPDAEGEIIIDDVRMKEINLQEARRCISVLGQSPVLFSGSLRKNLDLVEKFQDEGLWRALENVQLKELVESLEGQLDHELLEHGANVSVGERQLICLARVLLQQSKIVILDEPTAHVDPDTEQTIWNVVREKLRDSTVITIAHRLNTIKDCDMILVLRDGEVDGFDRFNAVENREGSALNEMARGADM